MSRYKVYPEYKDSGVEWLGEIPFQWEISPLKYLATFTGGGTPSKENPDFWDGNIPWVSPKDMKTPRISTTIDNITDSAIRQSSTNLLEKGALLMVVRSGILQHSIPVAINDVPISLNQDMKALRFSAPLLSEYAFYFVEGNQSRLLLEWSKEGATVESIEHEFLANTFFPCPPLSERTAIIAFLDHETAKIDALIEKQQRLIELLKEKRQAVISHAVTKGLNPNAPMKDSGVEWLGEVPAHWVVCRLKQAIKSGSSISYGIVQPGEPLDDGVPFVQTTNMSKGAFDIDDLQKTTAEIADSYPRSKLDGGEVILGIRASIGAAYVVPQSLAGANLSRGVARIIPNERLASEYLVLFFGTDSVRRYWDLRKQGSTFSEVSIETVREMSLLAPPKEEQIEIHRVVKLKISKIEDILNKAERKSILLQERRTALISAAVTGKIDVRDWQPAAAQEEVGIGC